MDIHEKVVKFLEEKDRLLFEASELHLMTSSDYIDIRSTDEKILKRWIKNVLTASESDKNDFLLCPFCFIFKRKCEKCSYRHDHLTCHNSKSTYQIMICNISAVSFTKLFIKTNKLDYLLDILK